jgi:tRNA dimethylallyltransferase
VGKTKVSIALSERLAGEIISADSRLLYRAMDIGTAKPTLKERARVPHHLLDVADPDQTWDLAQYVAAARAAIHQISANQRLPILVGGTGQYVRAIVEGWNPSSGEPDMDYRREMEMLAEGEGSAALHARLKAVDPVRAAELDHRNVRRVIRALEIHRQTGKPASEQRGLVSVDYDILQLGLTLERELLYERVDHRIDQMLESGLIEEVSGLLAQGYACSLASMSAIGYAQICAHLSGEISLDHAIAEMRRKTRQLIRYQYNWFKLDDPSIRWLEADQMIEDKALAELKPWLKRAMD